MKTLELAKLYKDSHIFQNYNVLIAVLRDLNLMDVWFSGSSGGKTSFDRAFLTFDKLIADYDSSKLETFLDYIKTYEELR